MRVTCKSKSTFMPIMDDRASMGKNWTASVEVGAEGLVLPVQRVFGGEEEMGQGR